MGERGGFNLTTGSNNIEIGNVGVAAEQHDPAWDRDAEAAYIAGISGAVAWGSGSVGR